MKMVTHSIKQKILSIKPLRGGFLYLFVLVFLPASALHAYSPQISEKQRQYERTASKKFNDELSSFQPRGKEEAAIKSILKKIKEAYKNCDKRPLLPIFSDNYTQLVFIPPSSAMTISRAKYFTGLAMGKVKGDECKKLGRQLSMAKIRIVRPKSSSGRINAVMLATYRSKYFKPRFIETFSFNSQNGKVVLIKKVTVPLYPKSIKYYRPGIYISELSEYKKNQADLKQMALDDADIFIERVLKGGNYSDSTNLPDGDLAVFALMKEPPPPGAKVKIMHRYIGYRGNLEDEFERTLTIQKVNPWFFITTWSEIGIGMTSVTYEINLDGKKILELTYDGP